MDGLLQLLPFVGIALVFWLLIIRPQSRRQRQQQELQAGVAVGDEVVLTSGFYGTVRSLDADRIGVELAPGTIVSVARGAVGSVVPDPALDRPAGDHDGAEPDQPETPDLTKKPDAGSPTRDSEES